MILVIFGHCLEIDLEGRVNLALYNTIYSFHMPLFVFVSGYFTRRYEDRKVFWVKIIKLFETLVIFNLLFHIPQIKHCDFSFIWSLVPSWILWYLLSLIWWRIALKFTPPQFLANSLPAILVLTTICLLAGFVPLGYIGSFQRTFAFFPFFLVGHICASKCLDFTKYLNFIYASIGLVLALFSAYWFADMNISNILYCSSPYNGISGLLSRILLYLVASVMCVAFMSIVKKVKRTKWLDSFGSNTMFVFLYHAPCVIILKWVVTHFELPSNVLFVGLYSILIISFLQILNKIKFFHILINPISYIYEKSLSCRRC